MPQASEELRAKFEDDYAARLVLEGAGWTCDAGWWSMPTHEPSEGEWEAITYLIHEWDHAIGKRPPTLSHPCSEVMEEDTEIEGAAGYFAAECSLCGTTDCGDCRG